MKKSILFALALVCAFLTLGSGAAFAAGDAAQIGTLGFDSIQDAINNANPGDIIKIMRDVEVSAGLSVLADDDIIIDLNGHTISYNPSVAGTTALITNKGKLTINDSSTAKTGKLINQAANPDMQTIPGYASNNITNSGTLIVNGGTIENATSGPATYAIDNNSTTGNATVTINGGHIKAISTAVRLFANSGVLKNTLVINGGTLEGKRAVWVQLPGSNNAVVPPVDVDVNGGILKSTDKDSYNLAIYVYSYGNNFGGVDIDITDGTIDGDIALHGGSSYGATGSESLNVTGGKFTGENGVYSYESDAGEAAKIEITGGAFAAEPSEDDLGDGLVAKKSVDGAWHVFAPVAKIDDVYYETLAEAAEEAEDGDVIEILKSYVDAGSIQLGDKDLIISLGDNTLSAEFFINDAMDLTILGNSDDNEIKLALNGVKEGFTLGWVGVVNEDVTEPGPNGTVYTTKWAAEVKNPSTGDNVVAFLGLVVLSVAALIGSRIAIKREHA